MAGRIRSGFPLVNRLIGAADSLAAGRSAVQRSLLCRIFSARETSRSYATASDPKAKEVKAPLYLSTGAGNYATALYLSAVKNSTLDKVESELFNLVEATKGSPKFLAFAKDPFVTPKSALEAMKAVSDAAKFSDITRNFLLLLAENGRLRYVEDIAEKFRQLTMAHRGEVDVTVTSVIPLPAEEEKELKETLQEVLGEGKTPIIKQKVDPSILGGLVVEYQGKQLDMSISSRAKQMERFLREAEL